MTVIAMLFRHPRIYLNYVISCYQTKNIGKVSFNHRTLKNVVLSQGQIRDIILEDKEESHVWNSSHSWTDGHRTRSHANSVLVYNYQFRQITCVVEVPGSRVRRALPCAVA